MNVFFYAPPHPVSIWCFDPVVGPSHLAPCSHLAVQKYNQPSAGGDGGPSGTLIPFGTKCRPHTSTISPAIHTTVLKLRTNLKSLACTACANSPPFLPAIRRCHLPHIQGPSQKTVRTRRLTLHATLRLAEHLTPPPPHCVSNVCLVMETRRALSRYCRGVRGSRPIRLRSCTT